MTMQLDEAFARVVQMAIDREGPLDADDHTAIEMLKKIARDEHGVSFPDDDVLGEVEIERDAQVIFIPLHELAGRSHPGSPVTGKIDEIDSPGLNLDGFGRDFRYRVKLDDAVASGKRTVVRAMRDELQLVAQP